MQRPRRKQYNAINAASLARWIVLLAFVAVTGLLYVYRTLTLNQIGNDRKALETELTSARLQNIELKGQIAALTSHAALQRRLKEGYLKMIPIAERDIVRLSPTTTSPAEDAIQPVANRQAGR
ncbi:MAG: hypothetical protein ACR2MW_12390 [Chthoniobacterales bacterium]